MSTVRGIESWQLDSISFEPKLDYGNYSLWSAKTELILQVARALGPGRRYGGRSRSWCRGSSARALEDARCRRASAAHDQHPRQMAVGDQTGTHGERGMGRAASALPAPVHVQEVARPAQVQFHEDLRGRGRPCPRTAHGQFVAGCLGHWRVRARGCRLFRPHYPRLPSVIVVRIRYGVEINGGGLWSIWLRYRRAYSRPRCVEPWSC
ncbi:hypothetical protein EDB83DRAFT_2676798 [Lactarius deliciosus]|nr:hypothetical protein EDB83DRAFT_2676798 [Lactarius deliciosus]